MQLRDLLWAIVDELMLKIDRKKTHTIPLNKRVTVFLSLSLAIHCMVNESNAAHSYWTHSIKFAHQINYYSLQLVPFG